MVRPRPILQCGYPSSGNYLLWQVLATLQRAAGCFSSFAERSGVAGLLRATTDPTLFPFPEAPALDCIRDGALQTPLARVPADLELVAAHASLLWSHDRPDLLAPFGAPARSSVYVVRDGRDALAAQLARLTSPRERRLHPRYAIDAPEVLARRPGYLERLARAWSEHVAAALAAPDYLVVRYEDLAGAHKAATVTRIAAHVGLPLDGALLVRVLEATDPERARERAPAHVRRATAGGHRDLFDAELARTYARVAGPVHRALGYGAPCSAVAAG